MAIAGSQHVVPPATQPMYVWFRVLRINESSCLIRSARTYTERKAHYMRVRATWDPPTPQPPSSVLSPARVANPLERCGEMRRDARDTTWKRKKKERHQRNTRVPERSPTIFTRLPKWKTIEPRSQEKMRRDSWVYPGPMMRLESGRSASVFVDEPDAACHSLWTGGFQFDPFGYCIHTLIIIRSLGISTSRDMDLSKMIDILDHIWANIVPIDRSSNLFYYVS